MSDAAWQGLFDTLQFLALMGVFALIVWRGDK